MVQIQLDLSKKESKIVALYKVKNDLPTKVQAIKHIINKVKQ